MPDCRQTEKELSRFLKEHEMTEHNVQAEPETEEPAHFNRNYNQAAILAANFSKINA